MGNLRFLLVLRLRPFLRVFSRRATILVPAFLSDRLIPTRLLSSFINSIWAAFFASILNRRLIATITSCPTRLSFSAVAPRDPDGCTSNTCGVGGWKGQHPPRQTTQRTDDMWTISGWNMDGTWTVCGRYVEVRGRYVDNVTLNNITQHNTTQRYVDDKWMECGRYVDGIWTVRGRSVDDM